MAGGGGAGGFSATARETDKWRERQQMARRDGWERAEVTTALWPAGLDMLMRKSRLVRHARRMGSTHHTCRIAHITHHVDSHIAMQLAILLKESASGRAHALALSRRASRPSLRI
eukprot:6210573-Pleurochrysis_carterae.AAC.1